VRHHSIGYTLWPATFELTEPGAFLDEAEALGVESVEVPLFCTRLVADGRIVEPAWRWFEGHISGRPFGITAHGMLGINLMDEADALPAHERVARTNIELAARMGARVLVIHCGLSEHGPGQALEDAYARQRESLARLADHAATMDVEICVETIWSFDGRSTALPSRLAEEIRTVGHDTLGATLDFAHCWLQCALEGADLDAELAAIAPLTWHLHLNDCFGRPPEPGVTLPAEAMAYGQGDLHLPLGWGALDWEGLLTGLPYPDRGLVLNEELHPAYWYALPGEVEELRRLRGLMLGVAGSARRRGAAAT